MRKFTIYLMLMAFMLSSSVIWAQQITTGGSDLKVNFSDERSSRDVLYDQLGTPIAGAYTCQNFETAYDIYDGFVADDFIVPPGEQWAITSVTATGGEWGGAGGFTQVNVYFYADDAGMPAATYFESAMNMTAIGSMNGTFDFDLPSAVILTPGTYWICVQAEGAYVTYGQWGFADNDMAVVNNESYFINPGGGFGPYTTWTPFTIFQGIALDMSFALNGTADPASIVGYALNGGGQTIAGVTIEETTSGRTTMTGPTGYYEFYNIADGTWTLAATKDGYNPATASVTTVTGTTVMQNFTLTAPNITISPLIFDETLHPNEYMTTYLSLLNTGDGPLNWTAFVVYPAASVANTTPPVFDENFAPAVETAQPGGVINVVPSETKSLASNRALLFDNGPLVNSPGTGSGGADESVLQSVSLGMNTLGGGFQVFYDNRIADDFEVTATWTVESFTFYGYQTNSSTTSTITGAYFTIYDGNPSSGGTAIWGDFVTNRMTSTQWSNIYRVTETSGGTTARPIMEVVCLTPSLTLDPGTYWVEVMLDGSLSSGPWCPPVTINGLTTTGNAQQNLAGSWGAFNDTGTGTGQGMPFLIEGSGGGGVGGWLTLDDYVGIVAPGGGSFNIGTNFDAAGTVAGEVYHADIEVYTNPNVGSIVIPVTMTIAGDPFPIIDDFTAELTDPVTGEVTLSWSALRDVTIEYYLIFRDGVLLTTVTTNSYMDMLPDFGVYEYELQPIFLEGDGVLVGPVEVEWFEPALCWDPFNPENTQWAETQQEVMLELENCNNGVLEFTFPDYAARALVSDPNFVPNETTFRAPVGSDEMKGKDDEFDGQGNPVIRGAGGPDAFGYVWIDSDEAGGPVFNWQDISGTGTVVGGLGDDNHVGPFPISFAFPFYGETKTQFWINSNGTVIFKDQYVTLGNSNIPTNSSTLNDFIAWFWDDLVMSASSVHYQDFGNRLVIQYVDVRNFGQTQLFDAQVIIYANGSILVQYDNIDAGTDISGNTIGCQSSTPAVGLSVAFNTAYVHDGLALYMGPPGSHFIVDVQPFYGLIGAGLTADITMTYSSEGFEEGDYNEDLFITTNEMPANEWNIPNTMHVVEPTTISGTVRDCNTGQPLGNVMVTAYVDTKDLENEFMTETAEDGTYMLYVNPYEDYYVMAEKLGYQTDATTVDAGDLPAVDVDFELCEEPYPVDWVEADPNEADTECMVTWSLPMGPYMISYDDGTAEDYYSWVGAGGMSAVKFTPAGYPVTVLGAYMNVGMDAMGSVEFVVLDDDGPGGMPGTILDSATVAVSEAWAYFDGFDVDLEDGDFYLAYRQVVAAPAAAPIGVDLDAPTVYRSYVKHVTGEWMVSAYNDFMMRAIVSGPGDNVMAASAEQLIRPGKLSPELYMASTAPNGVPGFQGEAKYSPVIVENPDRDLATYQLYRVSDIDPDNGIYAEDGTHTLIEPALTSQMYNDTDWEDLDAGFYAYGVTATYDNDDVSVITYSEIVAHLLDNVVTINVSQCDDLSPEGAEVMLTGQNYPFQELTATTDETGVIVFDSVINGTYDLVVTKTGYIDYVHNNIWIYDDYEENVVLQEVMMPARNLVVNPQTSIATWDSPYFEYMAMEEFEGADFPPAGWMAESNGTGWFQTDNGGSTFFSIPPGDGMYACVNDDASDYDGCCDYLILPEMDLTDATGFMLQFDAYFTGAFSQLGSVEYSLNGGTSWTLAANIPTATAWTTYQLELDMLAGEASVMLAFHADDQGFWASGLAIDNVMSYYGKAPVGYYVYLDGGFVAETAGDVTTYMYQNLTYGQTYEAAVRALYSCGTSEPIFYTFTSGFLYPPRNLMDEYVYGTNEIPVMWNPPMTVSGPAMDRSLIVKSTAPAVHAETNPNGAGTTSSPGRELWDIQYSFDMDGPSGLTGLAGAECDGEFIYATAWASNNIVKFDVDGNFIETFTIPGVSGLRDLAFDGTYMYGAAASTTVYKMDFTAQTLVSSFTAPTAVRAIAYDSDADGFWGNNWDTD